MRMTLVAILLICKDDGKTVEIKLSNGSYLTGAEY